jgi:uncharacterized protein (DUF2336 family)
MLKSSAYTPLDSLVDLACRDGVDIRPTLLRVLTDLYVQKPAHSADEEAQYTELALGLIDAVDEPTRAIVAARLAAYPDAPAAVRSRLPTPVTPPAVPAPAPADAEPAPQNDLAEMFFAAATDERRLILSNLAAATEPVAHRPTPAMNEAIRRLEAAALNRNPSEFARMLERALGISRALADRITGDASGEPVVVAARALGMSAAVLQRILLFLNPAIGHSVERVYDLAHLYDELTPAAAARMVAIWRQSGGRSWPLHEPLFWDDERRDARALSTPARYRSDRGRITRPSHVKTGGK